MQGKNILFYFTGTGNSLMAAERIGEKLGEYELCELSQLKTKNITDAARIGFICPVYYWGLPNVVKELLSEVKINTNAYVFAVITMGSSSGNALPELKELLSASGIQISYGADVKCPDNYSTLLGAQKPEKHKALLAEAEKQLEQIGTDILNKKEKKIPKKKPLLHILFSGYRKSLRQQDKKFIVEDKCIGCGKCARECPVQNIEMIDDKPVWQHHCEFCLSCISGCTIQAIELGKRTFGKPRYQNPVLSENQVSTD